MVMGYGMKPLIIFKYKLTLIKDEHICYELRLAHGY